MKVEVFYAGNLNTIKNVCIEYRGYAYVDEFDPEQLWHLCNWSEYTCEKPKEVEHVALSSVGSGVIFHLIVDENDISAGKWYLAKPYGFEEFNTLPLVIEYLRKTVFKIWGEMKHE